MKVNLAWYDNEWNRIIGKRDAERGKEILLERFDWWKSDVWVFEKDIEQFKEMDW
jgi:hypothetical protein